MRKMRFQIDGKEVYVHFHHIPDEPEEGFICTEVVIESDHPEIAALGGQIFGRAFCHPNDQFCKRTGRKIALERALYVEDDKHERIISRAFTTPFWSEYFKGIPNDKVNTRQRWVQLPNGEFVRMAAVVEAIRFAKEQNHPLLPMEIESCLEA